MVHVFKNFPFTFSEVVLIFHRYQIIIFNMILNIGLTETNLLFVQSVVQKVSLVDANVSIASLLEGAWSLSCFFVICVIIFVSFVYF